MNIVVTGASRGIGYATVKAFAEKGVQTVIAIARNRRRLEKLKEDCNELFPDVEIIILASDLSVSGVEVPLEKVATRVAKIDVLVNNAGVLVNKPFKELTGEDFDTVFNVNVKSVFTISKVLLPYFNKGAHIVNIGSMGGVQGSVKFPGLSLYSASKGAVAVLTETMAEEFKDMGVSVNCLAPGAVQTDMLSKAFPDYKAPIDADEMAGFIVDFALTGDRFFNGKILPVSISTP